MPFLQGVKNNLHIWNPRPRFAYSLSNFYWATTTIKGRLLSSRPMLKPFSGEKNSKSRRNVGPKWQFLGENGGRNLRLSKHWRHSVCDSRNVDKVKQQRLLKWCRSAVRRDAVLTSAHYVSIVVKIYWPVRILYGPKKHVGAARLYSTVWSIKTGSNSRP